MAEHISEKSVASVRLLTLEISEDELAVYVAGLNRLLEQCDDEILEQVSGALRDEIEAMRDDLTLLLDTRAAELLAVRQS